MKIKYVAFALMFTSLQGMKKEADELKNETPKSQTAEELHAKEVAELNKEIAELGEALKEKLTDPHLSDQQKVVVGVSVLDILLSGISK